MPQVQLPVSHNNSVIIIIIKLAQDGTDRRLFITDVSAKFNVTWHKKYDKYKKLAR